MGQNEKILNFWFPVIIYSGIIYFVSAIPNLKGPGAELNFDKIIHCGEYIPFGFLISRALNKTNQPHSSSSLLILTLILTVIHAIGDEFHQSFVPGRSCDWHDVLADSIGGMVGGSIYLAQHFKTKVRHR